MKKSMKHNLPNRGWCKSDHRPVSNQGQKFNEKLLTKLIDRKNIKFASRIANTKFCNPSSK